MVADDQMNSYFLGGIKLTEHLVIMSIRAMVSEDC